MIEEALREPTQNDSFLDLFINREDLVSKVEFGRHLGHSDHKVTKLKIPVYSRKSAAKPQLWTRGKTNFRLLMELVNKIVFLHRLGLSVLVNF